VHLVVAAPDPAAALVLELQLGQHMVLAINTQLLSTTAVLKMTLVAGGMSIVWPEQFILSQVIPFLCGSQRPHVLLYSEQ
jgi:hypothetical protein